MLRLAASIKNPAKREIHSVICFLHAKEKRPEEINKEVVCVYRNIMNRQNITKCCCAFSRGRINVHEETRTGRPSVITDVHNQKRRKRLEQTESHN